MQDPVYQYKDRKVQGCFWLLRSSFLQLPSAFSQQPEAAESHGAEYHLGHGQVLAFCNAQQSQATSNCGMHLDDEQHFVKSNRTECGWKGDAHLETLTRLQEGHLKLPKARVAGSHLAVALRRRQHLQRHRQADLASIWRESA